MGATLSELQRYAAWRRPLRQQIIVPFLLLLVFVAVVGVAALTYQATSAGMAGFDQSLIRASVQANDRLATLESGRLNDLRALSARPGLAAALTTGDGPRLSVLYAADVATARQGALVIRILDAKGNRVVSIPADPTPAAYARLPVVRHVLLGANVGRGDKYAALVREGSGPIVYWAAPIRDPHGEVIGAVLLGESISGIAAEIHGTEAGRLFFYDVNGQPLEGSLPTLGRDVRQSVTSDHLMRVSATA